MTVMDQRAKEVQEKCKKLREGKRETKKKKESDFEICPFPSLRLVLFNVAYFITPQLNRTGLYSTGPAQTRSLFF